MTNMTLSVPEELKLKMEQFKIMNWSEVAREAFVKKVEQLSILEEFTRESEFTKEDALRLGKKVNEALAKRYKLSKELR